MILWAAFSVALCGLLSIHIRAEVVNSFNGCSDFFYKNEEPSGFDQNAIKICQKLRNRYFYATLYSTYHRIPLYSAYKFDYHCRKNKEARPSGNWCIEPQLSGYMVDYMDSENKYQSNSIKNSQAINADYARSGYDRGHLSPNSFQCNEGREVTFTLTNSAPMVGRFNRVHWRKWESAVRKLLEKQDPSGTAYLVTGTVPASNNRIPRQSTLNQDQQDLNRVTVPSHVWTAVCYYNEIKRDKSFSFGFIGENDQDGSIGFKTIPQLTQDLSEKYSSTSLRIFRDECIFLNTECETQSLYSGIQLSLPCFLFSRSSKPNDELRRKRRQISQEVVCRLLPENPGGCTTSCLYDEEEDEDDYDDFTGAITNYCSSTYSDLTANGQKCLKGYTCGKHGSDYYWCYTSGSWDYCSPPLPAGLTKSGKPCSVRRNCAEYGESYFWCETNGGKAEHCCRRADRFSAVNGRTCTSDSPCNYYGYNYLWCYTTDGTWDYCCTS